MKQTLSAAGRRIGLFLYAGGREAMASFWVIFKLTFPIILAIRLIEEVIPLVAILGEVLEPFTLMLGLPGELGVAWAAAMLVQPLSGYVVVAERWHELQLTAAQATVFAILVLEVHAIIVEVRIAQLLGVRAWVTCVLRFGFALGLGIMLERLYRHLDVLQEPATLLFINPPATGADTLAAWAVFQLQSWTTFAVLIVGLTLLMNAIRAGHIENMLHFLLRPFMALMGIHRAAGTVSIVGLILGISFGAAMLLAEKRKGVVSARDMFLTVSLLGVCHSLLDDTLVALLFGAHISGVLVARLACALLFMAVFARLLRRVPEARLQRWFMTRHASAAGAA